MPLVTMVSAHVIVCSCLFNFNHLGNAWVISDTYVGGLFSLAGNTTVLNGSAKYSNGVWHEMDSPGAIGSLYGYQSLLFYSYSYGYTSELNMVATNTLTNEDVFATVPTYVSGSRAPSVFYVFSNYIFVGGSFEVRLPDGTLAYGCKFFFFLACKNSKFLTDIF